MLQDWRTFGRAAKWEGEGKREFDGGPYVRRDRHIRHILAIRREFPSAI
jgi:hypothetical protein